MSDYKLNENDIDSVINYLKLTDPENATPEMAIAILEHMQATIHTLAHEDPDLLEKMYEEVKSEKTE